MKKVVLFVAIVAAVIAGLNYFNLHRLMMKVLQDDSRNDGIEVWCHYDTFVLPQGLVFDLRVVSAGNSQADVFRVLLQFAEAMKSAEFETVHLKYRGVPKFQLSGSYFRKLGEEYERQNPAYTMRTFPQNLQLPDGSSAYSEWRGGLLGVLQRQTEDFSDFHRRWYVNDLRG